MRRQDYAGARTVCFRPAQGSDDPSGPTGLAEDDPEHRLLAPAAGYLQCVGVPP
jgi:hypothetical protein